MFDCRVPMKCQAMSCGSCKTGNERVKSRKRRKGKVVAHLLCLPLEFLRVVLSKVTNAVVVEGLNVGQWLVLRYSDETRLFNSLVSCARSLL